MYKIYIRGWCNVNILFTIPPHPFVVGPLGCGRNMSPELPSSRFGGSRCASALSCSQFHAHPPPPHPPHYLASKNAPISTEASRDVDIVVDI